MPDIVESVANALGATDTTIYLVDFGQQSLEPLPARRTHSDVPTREDVASTMAGRTFTTQTTTIAERDAGTRVWVPVVEGSDRTGVLALTVPEASDEVVATCEELGVLTGYLIAALSRTTDIYNLYRRRRSLSLAASMQWDLLPPLVLKHPSMVVAGLVEPAYDVGGDCFDYALNGGVFEMAVFDAMGHGVEASMISSLVVGSYRHHRREGLALEGIHQALDEVVTTHCRGIAFATGLLARIDLASGRMEWTNAGHPVPILIRNGSAVGELRSTATVPWGLGTSAPTRAQPSVGVEMLEPRDIVLLYTDGSIDARSPAAEEFGIAQLMDLVTRCASDELEPEEIVRVLVRSVLDFRDGELSDDATFVIFQWNG